MAKKTVAAKKRNVKVDANGQLHVHSSFNNIIVSLANSEGQIISWSSAGKMGFRGSIQRLTSMVLMIPAVRAVLTTTVLITAVRAAAVPLQPVLLPQPRPLT